MRIQAPKTRGCKVLLFITAEYYTNYNCSFFRHWLRPKALNIGEVFQTITARDINASLTHIRHNTASGLDGIQRKHIAGHDMKELLRILFKIILVSRIQPKAWNTNRMILFPKQGKDRSRVEDHRPLTIGSLIYRSQACGRSLGASR